MQPNAIYTLGKRESDPWANQFAPGVQELALANKALWNWRAHRTHVSPLERGEKNVSPVNAPLMATEITYLKDSGCVIAGLNFWRSPVQPRFYDWAFNRDGGADIARHQYLIHEQTDVLMTHGPCGEFQTVTLPAKPSGVQIYAGAEKSCSRGSTSVVTFTEDMERSSLAERIW